HPRFKTPYVAVHVQGALGVAVALVLGFALGGPLLAFALLGTIATIIIVFIYILTNLANLIYYMREQRAELNPIWNVVVPIVGVLIFIPVLLAAFGIDFGGLGIAPLTAPANAAPWVVVAWIVLGVVVFALYRVQYWGGPSTYSDQRGHPRLRLRHQPFAIGQKERDAWLGHMQAAVDSLELSDGVRKALLDYFETASTAMINAGDEHET